MGFFKTWAGYTILWAVLGVFHCCCPGTPHFPPQFPQCFPVITLPSVQCQLQGFEKNWGISYANMPVSACLPSVFYMNRRVSIRALPLCQDNPAADGSYAFCTVSALAEKQMPPTSIPLGVFQAWSGEETLCLTWNSVEGSYIPAYLTWDCLRDDQNACCQWDPILDKQEIMGGSMDNALGCFAMVALIDHSKMGVWMVLSSDRRNTELWGRCAQTQASLTQSLTVCAEVCGLSGPSIASAFPAAGLRRLHRWGNQMWIFLGGWGDAWLWGQLDAKPSKKRLEMVDGSEISIQVTSSRPGGHASCLLPQNLWPLLHLIKLLILEWPV